MYINKAIRRVMKEKNISLGAMAKILWNGETTNGGNKRTGNAVSSRLNNKNMSFDIAVEMLDILGYEIVIQKKTQGNRRADQIVIDQCEDKPSQLDLDALLSDAKPTKC